MGLGNFINKILNIFKMQESIDDKRKKLVELIVELEFPMSREEAEDNALKLTEEDLDILIKNYEGIREYRKEIHEAAKALDRKAALEIEEDFRKKMEALQNEYMTKLEVIKGEEDVKLRLIEEEAERKQEELLAQAEKEADEVEEAANDITENVKNLLGNK